MHNRRFTRVVMFMGILLAAIALPAWAGDDDGGGFSVLDGERLSNQLAGPQVEADDYRDKVTLIVYWDGDYNTAGGWMPDVKKLQETYYGTGKFMVVAVQTGKDESVEDLKNFASGFVLNFPVFHRMSLDTDYQVKALDGVTGPLMALLDTKGNVVAKYDSWQLFDADGAVLVTGSKGSFTGKLAKVLESTIQETIDAIPVESPMLEGVELVEFKDTEAEFQPGTNIKKAYEKLERAAKKEDDEGVEAQAMINAIDAWIAAETAELEALQENDPPAALIKAEMLYTTIRGLDGDRAVRDIGKTLRKERNTADLVTLIQLVDEANDLAFTEGDSSKFEKKFATIKAGVESYTNRPDLKFADKQQAEDLLDEIRKPIEAEKDD